MSAAATLAWPGANLAPMDESGVADVIAIAAGRGSPLRIAGNETRKSMLRPVDSDTSLSTRALTGITLYEPKELIISARAGTPVADIERALAEHGQYMIAEPPAFAFHETNAAPTLGGLVAANLSGPRRVAWGATRDHVMGVRAVNGRGEVLRFGGRVLKNVTGLDICKLLTGSHGTLAVLTEVTLKVLPKPEATGGIVIAGLDAAAAVAAMSAALGSPYGVSGAAYLPAAAAARVPAVASLGASATLIRIEDFSASVAYRIERLLGDLGGDRLDDPTTRAAFAAIRDVRPLADAAAVWRISVRPSRGPDVARAVEAVGAATLLDWGGGLVWVAGFATAEVHAAVVAAAAMADGTYTVMRSPSPFAHANDVVPPEPAVQAKITQAMKAAFDPAGILNPGRLFRAA